MQNYKKKLPEHYNIFHIMFYKLINLTVPFLYNNDNIMIKKFF